MTDIKIVSASAGTGKTYYITKVLKERIQNGSVRPDKVVATTFTVKAAAELAERVRGELLGKNMIDEARTLQAARVGTVHAMCAELIQDYAFEAGLSPQLRVLDESDASALLKKVLDEVVDEPRHDELMAVNRRMDHLEWDEALRSLVEMARTNRIDGASLRDSSPISRARSIPLTLLPLNATRLPKASVVWIARDVSARRTAPASQKGTRVDFSSLVTGSTASFPALSLRVPSGATLRSSRWPSKVTGSK